MEYLHTFEGRYSSDLHGEGNVVFHSIRMATYSRCERTYQLLLMEMDKSTGREHECVINKPGDGEIQPSEEGTRLRSGEGSLSLGPVGGR